MLFKNKGIKNIRKKSKRDETASEITEAEILSMVNEGNENGSLLNSEAIMVKNVLNLDDETVKDIMIHRTQIVAIDGDSSIQDAVDMFVSNSFSRFPVFIGSIDNIIGIIHIKDILKYASSPSNLMKKVRDESGLIRPAESVPETHGVYTLFTTMKREKTHMAVVVDEYGQTSGIVTMEDILEEIVGNIQDEHDNEKALVEKLPSNSYRMNGRTPLEDVCETLGINIELPDVETLNGYLINKLGKIPDEHSKFKITDNGYDFNIMDVKDRVIQEVRISLHK